MENNNITSISSMCSKGLGGFGTFTVTHDITKYTRASIFASIGKKTDCFVRFATVSDERRVADAKRDIRSFDIRFYTDAGNWDLAGANTPVSFLRDPLKVPDLNNAQNSNQPVTLCSADNNWDFWTLHPESLHQITITMSDRGIPATYMHMNGFGSNTFNFINKDNVSTWVKIHLKTCQGIKNLTDLQAEAVIAQNKDSRQCDLYDAIERGDFPGWEFKIQVMTHEDANKYRINPFDNTKVWSHKKFPLIDAGILELNKNPEDYFAQVEQFTINPKHIVDGIDCSNNDHTLPNSLFSFDDDYYSQPRDLFRLMSPEQQQELFENTARNMREAELFVKQRHVRNCHKADPAYADGVAKALGIVLYEALLAR